MLAWEEKDRKAQEDLERWRTDYAKYKEEAAKWIEWRERFMDDVFQQDQQQEEETEVDFDFLPNPSTEFEELMAYTIDSLWNT